MIVELVPIANMGFEKVKFYSAKLEGKRVTEFADFTSRMNNDRDRVELAEINRYIQNIGQKLGAFPEHFKNEDAAERLPPPYHQFIESENPQDFGLRLYCIRLSPAVVILLNGDRKTALKVNQCKNCFKHFNLARKLSKRITEAISEKLMEIDEDLKEIGIDEEFELNI